MTDRAIPADAHMTSFVCVTDRARTKRFYGETLGLTLIEDTPFALVYEQADRLLRISDFPGLAPQPFTVVGWVVKDMEAVITALLARGVVFNRYPQLEQDELGRWQPPGSQAWVAWFNDPDGNVLSLSTAD